MKYAFIQRHRKVWPISVQCRVLEVCVAGYHESHRISKIERAQSLGAYLKDVFERLPTRKNSDLAQLLPHNWRPANYTTAPTTTLAASVS